MSTQKSPSLDFYLDNVIFEEVRWITIKLEFGGKNNGKTN